MPTCGCGLSCGGHEGRRRARHFRRQERRMNLCLRAGVTLFLARHGETRANSEHRFSGRRDTPLTEKGLSQAHAVGEILKREVGMRPKLAFVSSPLARARATMQIVRGV